jgi:hypothetical protein
VLGQVYGVALYARTVLVQNSSTSSACTCTVFIPTSALGFLLRTFLKKIVPLRKYLLRRIWAAEISLSSLRLVRKSDAFSVHVVTFLKLSKDAVLCSSCLRILFTIQSTSALRVPLGEVVNNSPTSSCHEAKTVRRFLSAVIYLKPYSSAGSRNKALQTRIYLVYFRALSSFQVSC